MKIKIKTFFWLMSFTFFCMFFLASCKDSKVYDVTILDVLVDSKKYDGKNISLICNIGNANPNSVWCHDPSNQERHIKIENETIKSKEQLRWALQYCNALLVEDNNLECMGVRTTGILKVDKGWFRLNQAEFVP
jgi:hypothetical protein